VLIKKKLRVKIINGILPLNLKLQNSDRNINSLLGQYKKLKNSSKQITIVKNNLIKKKLITKINKQIFEIINKRHLKKKGLKGNPSPRINTEKEGRPQFKSQRKKEDPKIQKKGKTTASRIIIQEKDDPNRIKKQREEK